jgi:hypothetical protein
MGWSCLCSGYKQGVCFRDTQLGTLIHESPSTWRYDMIIIWHRSKNENIKDGKMVLIAYHLLESSIDAYIEWLVKELLMTTNKI